MKVEGCKRGDVPEDVGITIDLGLPFSLAAVAASMVGSHDCGYVVVLEKRLCVICFEVQIEQCCRRRRREGWSHFIKHSVRPSQLFFSPFIPHFTPHLQLPFTSGPGRSRGPSRVLLRSLPLLNVSGQLPVGSNVSKFTRIW